MCKYMYLIIFNSLINHISFFFIILNGTKLGNLSIIIIFFVYGVYKCKLFFKRLFKFIDKLSINCRM